MAEHALRGRLGNAAFEPHLRLLGALARLWSVTGRPEMALQMQRQVAHGLFERGAFESVSYPLSEWYRLAGALRDREAFVQGEEMRDRVEGRGGLGFEGNAYVTLSRARARILLGGIDDGIEKDLDSLRSGKLVHSHVRWSAARWLATLYAGAGKTQREVQIRFELTEAARAEGALPRALRDRETSARVFAALADLDRALSAGDSSGAAAALKQLRRLERGLLANLSAVAPRKDLATYFARFYPY
jgi:hypothetical protein